MQLFQNLLIFMALEAPFVVASVISARQKPTALMEGGVSHSYSQKNRY